MTGCLDEIRSLKANLDGLEREILSLNVYERRRKRASHIERDLLDLRVVVSRRMEESSKKERIDLFQEGVAIILRVTRDDSWLAEAVANTYRRLTLGCLVSIVREFLTCQ